MSTIGARVTIHGSFGRRERNIVTGDTHYAQHPAAAHFGLGDINEIYKIEVDWQGERITLIENPEVDRYYVVVFDGKN